jgi:hypothetical protein
LSPVALVVLGFVIAALIAALVFVAAWFLAPARARRAAVAALIGGTAGFTTTALVQAPFYMQASAKLPIAPMVVAFIASAGAALLTVWMTLRLPPRNP